MMTRKGQLLHLASGSARKKGLGKELWLISLTLVLRKVMEKIFAEDMPSYKNKNKATRNSHNGFTKNKSYLIKLFAL